MWCPPWLLGDLALVLYGLLLGGLFHNCNCEPEAGPLKLSIGKCSWHSLVVFKVALLVPPVQYLWQGVFVHI